jgi:hypothetical protein
MAHRQSRTFVIGFVLVGRVHLTSATILTIAANQWAIII